MEQIKNAVVDSKACDILELLKGSKDLVEVDNRLSDWIITDIEEEFENTLDILDTSLVSSEVRKKIYIDLYDKWSMFLNNINNIIYLKLSNLYNEVAKTKGENQKLYFIVDLFTPDLNELTQVNKDFEDILTEYLVNDCFKDFFNNYFCCYNVIKPYRRAAVRCQDNLMKRNIRDFCDKYEDKQIYKILHDDALCSEYFLSKASSDVNLASVVSSVLGYNLNPVEQMYLQSKLNNEQSELLASQSR